jgi:hypothetical protein
MLDIGEALTRKLGPLPVWAWGAVVGGGLLVAKTLTGGGGGGGASVSPVALNAATGDLPDLGASGSGSGGGVDTSGSSGVPGLGYVTLPGGQTVIDRAPGDVTIIPGATAPASTAGMTSLSKAIATLNLTAQRLRRLKPKAAKAWAKRHPVPKTETPSAKYSRLTGEVLYLGKAKGDTSYAIGGDTSPDQWSRDRLGDAGVPIATIGQMHTPLPLGRVALPAYDATRAYRGPMPTFSTTPIVSSARIIMPPVNGPTGGSIAAPSLPASRTMAPVRGAGRMSDPVAIWLDRLTPNVPPTTMRPRLRLASWVTTRADNVSRRNASG